MGDKKKLDELTQKELEEIDKSFDSRKTKINDEPEILTNDDIRRIIKFLKTKMKNLNIKDGQLILVEIDPAIYFSHSDIVMAQIKNVLKETKKKRIGVMIVPKNDDYKFITENEHLKDYLKKYGFEYTGTNPMQKH